jgi:hypothetical protein
VAYFIAHSSGQSEASQEDLNSRKSRLKLSAFRTQGEGQYCTYLLDVNKPRNMSIWAVSIELFRTPPLSLPVSASQSHFKATQTRRSRDIQQSNDYHKLYFTVNILPSNIPRMTGSRKDGARPALDGARPALFPFRLLIVSFYVLFVCKCVLYYSHRVSTQLQLTKISHHTISYISYHIQYQIKSFIRFSKDNTLKNTDLCAE